MRPARPLLRLLLCRRGIKVVFFWLWLDWPLASLPTRRVNWSAGKSGP